MKASELLDAFENFIAYRYTPSEEGVRYGCDCGCGGDFYLNNPDLWDEAHEIVYGIRTVLKELLEKLNIENDLEELR